MDARSLPDLGFDSRGPLRRYNVIGYALGGLFVVSFVASLAGLATNTPWLYASGGAVCAVVTVVVCVGVARAARVA
jgi:hypothetical protein